MALERDRGIQGKSRPYRIGPRQPQGHVETDQAALGAYRSHRCACSIGPRDLCPYHLMADQLDALGQEPHSVFVTENGEPPSKQGWADTFQALAKRLNIPTHHGNGARAFTGHSARVSGARHLASTQVELWRAQLYGRWGSNVFVRYIQDAPLAQLDSLALESSASMSIQEAKLQLQDLLRQVERQKQLPLAPVTLDMLEDCEASVGLLDEPSLPETTKLVLNTNVNGKLHKLLAASPENHPKWWKTKCGWRFGQDHTEFEWIVPGSAANVSRNRKFLRPHLHPALPLAHPPTRKTQVGHGSVVGFRSKGPTCISGCG